MRRSNGTRIRLNISRWAIIALAVVLALGSVGYTYACWRGGGYGYCDTVHTYCFDNTFTWVVSNDNGSLNSVSPYGVIDPGDNGNDPSEPQSQGIDCARYAKNVALTTAQKCHCTPNFITVTVCNGYPCYYPTVFFGMKNLSQIDGVIEDIIIDENYTGPCDTTANDIPELDVSYGGIYIGQEIAACVEVIGSLKIHVEQPAKENWTYRIKLKIKLNGDCCCSGSTGPGPWPKWKKHHHHKRQFKGWCQDINTPAGAEEGWLIHEMKNIGDQRNALI